MDLVLRTRFPARLGVFSEQRMAWWVDRALVVDPVSGERRQSPNHWTHSVKEGRVRCFLLFSFPGSG